MTTRILVIEDSPTQATRVKYELVRYGVEVTIASTGVTGLDTARALMPDAIVLDIELPEKDGYSVCRELKQDIHTAHIPIVMLTHYDTARNALEGIQLGAIDYIPKDSFAEHNLVESLRQLGVL